MPNAIKLNSLSQLTSYARRLVIASGAENAGYMMSVARLVDMRELGINVRRLQAHGIAAEMRCVARHEHFAAMNYIDDGARRRSMFVRTKSWPTRSENRQYNEQTPFAMIETARGVLSIRYYRKYNRQRTLPSCNLLSTTKLRASRLCRRHKTGCTQYASQSCFRASEPDRHRNIAELRTIFALFV